MRPRLNGSIKVASSDTVKTKEPIVYTGTKCLLYGAKQEFVQLLAY